VKPIRLVLCAILLASTLSGSAIAKGENPISWREQYAYSVGMAAYPYAFPYLHMARLRWMWTNHPRDPENFPYAPINHFWHATHLADAKYRGGGTPNNDAIYSIAWVNVGEEPIILSHPDMADRHFSFHCTSFTSDNFAVVSQRETGGAEGRFAIVNKDFKGELPEGVKALPTATTPWFLLIARTTVNGPHDLPNVLALQKQYRLTPLSYWGKPEKTLPTSRDIWAPFKPKNDPLANWKTINRAMTENPPPGSESALAKLLAEVNLGPGQNVDALDEDSKTGLARAAKDAHKMIIQARADKPGGTRVNGWRRSSDYAGREGLAGHYLIRGVMQSFTGITTNYPEEGRYFGLARNKEGDYLDAGKASYRLTFPAGAEPPVDAFWSLSLYGLDTNLVDNPLNRYSLGDRSPLQRNSDGSLTLYIQHKSPGNNKESNWLPAPNGPFALTLRCYRPQAAILNGEWQPPAVTTVNK